MLSPIRLMLLVPFYANAAFLERTLGSVMGQDDPDWQAIVVDDSPEGDEAAHVVARIADPRISYSRNEGNLGVAGSFNRCIELARERGVEVCAIVHADDELEPRYVRRVKQVHSEWPDAACVAPKVTVINGAGEPTRTVADAVKALMWPHRAPALVGEAGLQRLLRGQFFYCPAVSYRLSALPELVWNPRWHQVMDLELYGRLLLRGHSIRLEDERLYRYRRHAGTTTEANSSSMLRSEEETAVCRELAADAKAVGWPKAARAGRVRVAVRGQALLRACSLLARRRWAEARRAFGFALAP